MSAPPPAGPETVAFSFDLTAIFAGLLFALVMSELLRIGQVAVMVALLLAGGLVWTLFQGGAPGLTRLVETAGVYLETSAATGFLTGALIGKSLSTLLEGLRRAAAPKPPRRPGGPPRRRDAPQSRHKDRAAGDPGHRRKDRHGQTKGRPGGTSRR